MSLKELESQLIALSPAEKAEAIKLLVSDLTHTWPGIEKTPGVAGGAACIVRTRIPVWVLEGYRRLGWSEAQILENYPTLRAADLANARAYADANSKEIEQALAENQEEEEDTMRYAYLRLQPFNHPYYLTVTSTDQQILEHIVTEVMRLMPKASVRRTNDVSGQIVSCVFSKLDDRDEEVFHWLFRWLCERGWEPYGVHAKVWSSATSDIIYSMEIHHFRREI